MYKDGQPWDGIILSGFDPGGKLQTPGGTASWMWFPDAANLKLNPGKHLIRVEADSNKNLIEQNETNNSLTKVVECALSNQPQNQPRSCGIRLDTLSTNRGYPGDTFIMYGSWGADQGSKQPSINPENIESVFTAVTRQNQPIPAAGWIFLL